METDNINEQDENGNTRLHHSVRGGSIDIIRGLLNLGADPTIVNNDGKNAAMEAITLATESMLIAEALEFEDPLRLEFISRAVKYINIAAMLEQHKRG